MARWCLKPIENRKPVASNRLIPASIHRVGQVPLWTRTFPASAARKRAVTLPQGQPVRSPNGHPVVWRRASPVYRRSLFWCGGPVLSGRLGVMERAGGLGATLGLGFAQQVRASRPRMCASVRTQ